MNSKVLLLLLLLLFNFLFILSVSVTWFAESAIYIGNTPLHCAILEDHSHIAVSLLENGANPNAATGQKFTPLHYAAKRGIFF